MFEPPWGGVVDEVGAVPQAEDHDDLAVAVERLRDPADPHRGYDSGLKLRQRVGGVAMSEVRADRPVPGWAAELSPRSRAIALPLRRGVCSPTTSRVRGNSTRLTASRVIFSNWVG